MKALRKHAQYIVKTLSDAGFVAYFAGGCVRDELLGIPPQDYDIATQATPKQVLALFQSGKAVGAHFGVVVVTRENIPFEIATFRSDGDYRDGRRPQSVTFTNAEEDAKRRDFTINGLFYDPLANKVIDYVQGQEDLSKEIIRAIGDPQQRFSEDYLRLLRALRFAARFSFKIEETTWHALRENAAYITEISTERIRDELEKIFLHEHRVQGFDLLVESGLMQILLPEVMALQGCEQPPQFHPEGDVFMHTRLMLKLLPKEVSLPLVLSVLFHDIGKPPTQTFDEENQRIRFNGHDRVGAKMAEKILRRLKFSNEVIDQTLSAIANHMVFKDVQKMRVSKLKRFMARPTYEDEMELHRVDCLGSHGMLDNYTFLRSKEREFANEPLIPPPLVTGKDLLKMGWREGPEVGEILTTIQNLQLEQELNTREEALAWVKEKKSSKKNEK